MTKRVIQQEIQVRYAYPVVFTRNVFDVANGSLKEILDPAIRPGAAPRLMAVVDLGVASSHPRLTEGIGAYLRHHLPSIECPIAPVVVAAGEGLKSDRPQVERLIRRMADARIDRHSFVMGIGGGALLDAVGYAASLVHRGVRMIRLPTTVLAQNDAGVGVKTAINDPAGKNFLGTFSPPFAVVNDAALLATLPDVHWRDGIAEAFKVALIKDAGFFDWLCDNAAALADRDAAAMEHLIYRCAELHLRHIREGGDPFETGQARPLDFGHWSAHHLELMSGYRLSHGSAVAIGIMLDTWYAVRQGWLDAAVAEQLHEGLTRAGFTLWHDAIQQRNPSGRRVLHEGLDRFREHLGGSLCLTLPDRVGSSRNIDTMDLDDLEEAIQLLQQRAAPLVR